MTNRIYLAKSSKIKFVGRSLAYLISVKRIKTQVNSGRYSISPVKITQLLNYN